MVDKVKPLKIESSSTGGVENDFTPTEVDPIEDYIATKGIAFENLDTVYIVKDGNDIKVKDLTLSTPYTVNQLRTAINNSFSNATNGFTSTNVQGAIEEVAGKARITDNANHDGTGSTGRWLSRNNGVASNVQPLVIPESRQLKNISLTTESNSTGTVTVYKTPRGTPVAIATISLSASKIAYTTGLSVSLVAGNEIGYQVTSGSLSRPAITAEYQNV